MDPITIAMGLAQFVPGIIKLLTGSDKASEVAGKVVDVAKIVTGTQNGPAAIDAIYADPDKRLAFRQAMAAQQSELERMYLTDIQDARARDVALAKVSNPNHRANALAACAVLLVLVCVLLMVWCSDMGEFAKGGITLLIGRAMGWVDQVFAFEFGTTRANKVKDDTIKNMSK